MESFEVITVAQNSDGVFSLLFLFLKLDVSQ